MSDHPVFQHHMLRAARLLVRHLSTSGLRRFTRQLRATWGPKLGMRQMVISRYSFGFVGLYCSIDSPFPDPPMIDTTELSYPASSILSTCVDSPSSTAFLAGRLSQVQATGTSVGREHLCLPRQIRSDSI